MFHFDEEDERLILDNWESGSLDKKDSEFGSIFPKLQIPTAITLDADNAEFVKKYQEKYLQAGTQMTAITIQVPESNEPLIKKFNEPVINSFVEVWLDPKNSFESRIVDAWDNPSLKNAIKALNHNEKILLINKLILRKSVDDTHSRVSIIFREILQSLSLDESTKYNIFKPIFTQLLNHPDFIKASANINTQQLVNRKTFSLELKKETLEPLNSIKTLLSEYDFNEYSDFRLSSLYENVMVIYINSWQEFKTPKPAIEPGKPSSQGVFAGGKRSRPQEATEVLNNELAFPKTKKSKTK